MQAARYHLPPQGTSAGGALRVDEIRDPQPGANEVRLRVAYCGICGSDLARYRQLPAPGPALRTLLGPVSAVAGHEFVGVVDAAGGDVPPLWDDGTPVLGSRAVVHPQVACGACDACRAGYWTGCAFPERIQLLGLHRDGGFAEYVVAPFDHLIRIPDGLSLEHAALAEPLAVALHAAQWMPERAPSAPLCVIGDGPIGLLTAHLLDQQGWSDVTLIGRHAGRMALGARLGLTRLETAEGLAAEGAEQFAVVFLTAGAQDALELGLRALARGGTLITGAYLHGEDPGLHSDLVYQMIRREKAVRGAAGYSYAELGEAVRLLAAGRIDAATLIGAIIPLEEIVVQGFERLLGAEKAAGKILVQPNLSI